MPYSVSPHSPADLVAADVEADHELFALHAAGLGDQEVAQLVHEDHGAQAERHDLSDHVDRPSASRSQSSASMRSASDSQQSSTYPTCYLLPGPAIELHRAARASGSDSK